MSQCDHDLMESVPVTTDDQADTVPASPPRRDSMEDADSSLTRKRPRLDSGNKDNRDMSTDPAPSPAAATIAAPPAEQPVEMTIRSQPPSSSQPTDGADDTMRGPPPAAPASEADPLVLDSTENDFALDVDDDAATDSPPVVAVDDDDDGEDGMGDYLGAGSGYIQVDYDEEEYFRRFPYASSFNGHYMNSLRNIIQHFQGSSPLEANVLPSIALWLDDFPDRPSQSQGYYLDRHAFWEEFAILVNKVLIRRYHWMNALSNRNQDNDSNRFPFGDQFVAGGQSEDTIFYNFLSSYLRLCSRLLQVDVAMVLDDTEQGIDEPITLSYKHLKHICTIFRHEKANIFQLLNKEYATDTRKMVHRLTRDFIQARGVHHLLQYADAAYGKIRPPTQNWIATCVTQILYSVGWALLELPNQESFIDRLQYHRSVLHFFRTYTADLQAPNKVADVGVAKELLHHMADLLFSLCQWDEVLASELAREFMDCRDPESPITTPQNEETVARNDLLRSDPMHYPALAMNAWKFKLLRKYVVKGRMELRVTSIGIMDNALIEIWREYNASEQQLNHPVMQYLADFLLNEEVVDYIMSVDSHPQIISRSGNVVGFLVVTHRYSDSQTDAIWRTVAHSQDHRVVTATIGMLKSISGLMTSNEQLYICNKLYDLPIESYTLEIFRFFRDLSKFHARMDWSNVDHKSRPWNVCIRVIQDTSPSRESTKLTGNLHTEACDHLRSFTHWISIEERRQIYEECVRFVAGRTTKATGSIRAIHLLYLNANPADSQILVQDVQVGRHLAEELCAFVRAERLAPPHYTQAIALNYRMELLCLLLFRIPEAVPVDLYHDLWDHLLGKFAINDDLRDVAWHKFSEMVRQKPEMDFFKQLISTYVPSLEPAYYTGGVYDFVASYRFPTTRRLVSTEEGDKEVLEIRGAELLWSLVLKAPPGTIEDRCATLLAARYVEIDTDQGVTLEEVEDAHAALVERCTRELLSAYKTMRNKADEPALSLGTSDSMDIALSDDVRQQNELRFARTILLQKLLLVSIRTRPEFNRSQRSDSKVEIMRPEFAYVGAIEIRYQSMTTNEKQSVFVNENNTLHDLYTRLCHATGFTRINLFAKGQRINVQENSTRKVVDLDLGGLLLVQKAPGSEISQPVATTSANCSVFETSVLKHFEELFACMDGDDDISVVLFEFLSHFPFLERIPQAVIDGTAESDDIFPPGKGFQVKYAAFALQHKLREQLRMSELDDSFLANAVQLLDRAVLNEALLSNSLSGPHEVDRASVLVNVLLEFLKERPSQDTSSRYFSDAPLLVDRLTSIMTAALRAPSDCSPIVINAYATILEASLHSREIWESFQSKSNLTALHQTLLLNDPRQSLREQIALSIASVCGGDLPSTSPLTKVETASSFWKIIFAILPEAVRFPVQAEQLFDIAEQVFRSYDENSRDEDSLRVSLATWSNLLLHYTHDEFVGRDETDFVVLGFTKLLSCCIPSLKSFKKPLHVGPLMEKIFNKFLFVPRVTELNEVASQQVVLPVLESRTRKELYDLMLALAEDRSSFGMLLGLVDGLTAVEEDLSHKSFSIDRSNEIRSSTGYVGLMNPRAICYLNSLITQLFMNINFRKFMLGLNVADAGASQRLLSETQKLFAEMQNTYRKATDPRAFATCVKNVESAPIDINVQMDADEFYNLLFDQWEGQMLSPEIKQHFRSFYGGQTINQIKSKECDHVSERVESFFVVQCDVQGKANLQESLTAFVEGDVMEGDNKYKCEACGGKFVDAVKRTCLKDVADNLIFHLKRFDFDLVDMRRQKINDVFEFPSTIDVSQYNIDHLGDSTKPYQEDIFELVGVLVHSGTSENGHYYSYIRERPCPSESTTNWFEFNDRDVDNFQPQNIPDQCYGGMYNDHFPRQQKPFSAYMLFYQRRSAIQKDHGEYISSPHCGIPKVPVPSNLQEEIIADNETFVTEYSLYDPNHSKFVRQILTTLRTVNHGTCSEDHQQETQALHIVLEHLSQVVCRLRLVENFDETMLQLRKTVMSCPSCCHIALQWLASHEYPLIALLLRCLHMKVRSQVRAFLIDSLRFLRERDPVLYGVESADVDMESGTIAPIEGTLVAIIRRLRKVANETGVASRGWDDFYLTLCQISSLGHIETAIVLNHGFLEFCLRVLLMYADPRSRVNEDIWRIVEKKKNIYNRLIEFVYTLLSRMDIRLKSVPSTFSGSDRLEYFDRSLMKFPLAASEERSLVWWHEENRAFAVLDRMIEQFDCARTEIFYPGEVLKWMLQSPEPRIQEMLYITVSEGVHALNPPFSDPYVRAALPYCQASPVAGYVAKVIETVAKSASVLRDTGGEAHIYFFNGLLTIENEAVSEEKGPDFFYHYALNRSRVYAVPLLIYDDDAVRKAALRHLEDLFAKHKPDDSADEASLGYKYRAIRPLIKEMTAKIHDEQANGTSRSYMQPMISTVHLLVHILHLFSNSEDPALQQLQQANDKGLIERYRHDVENKLRHWQQEDGTPISTGEAYEQSDYGSESDDGADLLDA